jgi:hypothetical protein
MPDRAMETLPRIALVFGDEAAVAHVREAMVGHVEIAYASAAVDFDAARLASAGAASALVNLDGGGWLETVESALHAAGIAVVYNDPEISQSLEGWSRARWLRHLVAKLRGSRDVDPPRPEAMSRVAATKTPAVVADAANPQVAVDVDESAFAISVETTGTASPAAVVELPLSSEEIETMTVDFAGGQVSAPAIEPVTETAQGLPGLGVPSPDESAQAVAVEQGLSFEPVLELPAETIMVADEPLDANAQQEAPADFDFEAEAALDVDTEALSAMIDARLAEPSSAENAASTQVWREVSGDNVPAAPQDQVCEAEPMKQDTPNPEPLPAPAEAVNDDADVLASLPSLDDWALVDPDVAPATAADSGARKSSEPVLSDAFAGLELVPMETVVPLRVDADPIERWFGGDSDRKTGADDSAGSKMKEVSHEHG